MVTHMQHENSFIDEMVRFVQPSDGTVGTTIILRLPDGNFVHQTVELPDRMFREAHGTFDALLHDVLNEILAVARRGPGTFIIPDVQL